MASPGLCIVQLTNSKARKLKNTELEEALNKKWIY